MSLFDEEKSQGSKSISTKLSREEFTYLQNYCKQNGETINAVLKRMILSEINNPHPSKIAGKSVFEYNKNKDNFSWKIVLDEGTNYIIDDHLATNSLEQLLESLINAIEIRNSHIKKNNKESVSIPSNLLRRKNEN